MIQFRQRGKRRCLKHKQKGDGMKKFGKYIKPYWPYYILGPFFMLVEVAGEIILPWLLAQIINKGIANHDISYIISIGIYMIMTAVMMAAGGVLGAYFASKASVNFGADLRMDMFEKIQTFSFDNIDEYQTGSLITRLTNDITQIQNMIMLLLRACLRSPGILIGAIIMAFTINARLALVFVVAVPVLAVAITVIMRAALPRFKALQIQLDRLNSVIQESMVNIRLIKSFVRADYEEDKFANMNDDLKAATMKANKAILLYTPIMTLALNMTTVAVVWFGGNMVIGGSMEVGDLTAFTNYIIQIMSSMMMLSMVFLNGARAVASFRRVGDILVTKQTLMDPEESDEDAALDKCVNTGTVEFRNVSFSYYKEDGQKVLDNLSFSIGHGQTLGIIGPTGCGKSTLISMIPRLYDVDEGQVLVDGVDVRRYRMKNLRQGIGIVLQKNLLFSGSVYDNLAWGDEEADKTELEAASKMAQADGFVKTLIKGYDTIISQGGDNVSGGQKQRLCIARALVKKPAILILDDSTSAVDTATERNIRQELQKLTTTTKIIIAQRITSVMDADKILVLEEGRIIGAGTHKELLDSCRLYQDIYDMQMSSDNK